MKCLFCKRGGTSAVLRHGPGGWVCRDGAACLARVKAKHKTPSKRAAWKRKGAK